eukprot:4826862-Prymnesium_polylepis.1
MSQLSEIHRVEMTKAALAHQRTSRAWSAWAGRLAAAKRRKALAKARSPSQSRARLVECAVCGAGVIGR